MRSEERLASIVCIGVLSACASATPGGTGGAQPSRPSSAGATPVESTAGGDAGRAPSEIIFLSILRVTSSEQAKRLVARAASHEEFARNLRVRVQILPGHESLGELSRRSAQRVVDNALELGDLSKLVSKEEPTPAQSGSSFVIDYDEPALARPIAELEAMGPPVSPSRIESFVNDYITDKTSARGFDIASRVAKTRSGDCTEHAVLAAALLRRFGFPARVLFGIVLAGVRSDDREPEIMAAGHAWVEVYQEGRWNIIDAALYLPKGNQAGEGGSVVGVPGLPEGVKLRLAYLPINVVTDESPGYSGALMDEVGVDSVVRLDVDAQARSFDTR